MPLDGLSETTKSDELSIRECSRGADADGVLFVGD